SMACGSSSAPSCKAALCGASPEPPCAARGLPPLCAVWPNSPSAARSCAAWAPACPSSCAMWSLLVSILSRIAALVADFVRLEPHAPLAAQPLAAQRARVAFGRGVHPERLPVDGAHEVGFQLVERGEPA